MKTHKKQLWRSGGIWSIIVLTGCASAPKESNNTRFNVNDSSASTAVMAAPAPADTVQKSDELVLTEEEWNLYGLIMYYRSMNDLPEIPLSRSLTYVAQQHCIDLAENKPDIAGPACNAHSWSDKGKWSACCYTPDHKQAQCMCDKPKELTSYTGLGFEISCGSSEAQFENYVMTARYALDAWKNSAGHNDVILNKNAWTDMKWLAIGVGIYKGFACVWFGSVTDPAGTIEHTH